MYFQVTNSGQIPISLHRFHSDTLPKLCFGQSAPVYRPNPRRSGRAISGSAFQGIGSDNIIIHMQSPASALKTAHGQNFKTERLSSDCAARKCESGWRSRRDSNPRYAFGAYNGLANRRLQPLGHSSVNAKAYRIHYRRSNSEISISAAQSNCARCAK